MTFSPDFTAYEAKMADYAARTAALLPAIKAALFTALSEAGIKLVVVDYDGSGDSGQLEGLTAIDEQDRETELPETSVAIQEARFEQADPVAMTYSLRGLLEQLAWRFLDQTHGGWENGDGAQGAFTFTAADQSITLDHNERFIDFTHSNHRF